MRLLIALALSATAVAAQPVWRPHAAGPSVSLDVLTSVGEDPILFTGDLGESLGEGRVSPFQSPQILSSRELTVGGGVRLPLASGGDGAFSSSLFTGLAADFERPEAFLAHVASATLGVARQVTPAVAVRIDLAPTLPVQPGVLVRVPLRGEFRPDPVVGRSLTVPVR